MAAVDRARADEFPRRFGKYTLLSHLASGGMADVFLARKVGPAGFQKECVIKRIQPHLTQDASNTRFIEMFLDEARIVARLSHPNIVNVLDFGQVESDYFIAMEHVDGMTLAAVLERTAAATHPWLPFPLACRIVGNVAEGLEHAHKAKDTQGRPLLLVHRDVSPTNIMVSWDGVAKVLDFGIAKAMIASESKVRTGSGIIRGKLPYMSPEQIQGLDLDARSDLFSLCAVLYELLTGQQPFPGDTTGQLTLEITSREPVLPSRVNPSLPPDLEQILLRGLAKSPDARYQSARDLKVDLEQFLLEQHSSCTNYDVEAYLREIVPTQERLRPVLPDLELVTRLEDSIQEELAAEGQVLAPQSERNSSGPRGKARSDSAPSTTSQPLAPEPPRMSPQNGLSLLASTSGIDALEAEERQRGKARGRSPLAMSIMAGLIGLTALLFLVLRHQAVRRTAASTPAGPATPSGPAPAANTSAPVPEPTAPTGPTAASPHPVSPHPTPVAQAPSAPLDKPKPSQAGPAPPDKAASQTPKRPKTKREDAGPRLSLPPPPPADAE